MTTSVEPFPSLAQQASLTPAASLHLPGQPWNQVPPPAAVAEEDS